MKKSYSHGLVVHYDEDGKMRRRPACRPVGSGRYGEPTKLIRIPCSLIPFIETLLEKIVEMEAAKRVIVTSFGNSTYERDVLCRKNGKK
ncbi:MAG: hypothetical protein Q4C96_10995 [Planctomycetia bacterium]|nr:hypothetical protein [Planctomycetia bacterium]